MKINEERMKNFVDFFNKDVFPQMKGKDGNGLSHFRNLVKLRREEVEKAKIKRNNKSQ